MSHSITDAGYLPLAMPPKAQDTDAAAKDTEADATAADREARKAEEAAAKQARKAEAAADKAARKAEREAKDKKRELSKKARERARGIARKARSKARETARAARQEARKDARSTRKERRAETDADADASRESEDVGATYSIDELSARTGVPSRTIRFYQAQHVLPKPRKRGRVAVYTDDHVARLEIISQLQDRGLRLRGMKQLLARKDSETAVKEWLGLSDKLSTPWTEDRARAVDEAEMTSIIGDRPAGTLAAVVRAGLATRPDDAPHTYFIPSPGLLDVALRLLDSGLTIDVLSELEPVLREGLRNTASNVVDYFANHHALGDPGDTKQMEKSLEALRTLGADAINIIFAQELERTFTKLLESGVPDAGGNGKRRRGGRRRS